MNYSERLNRVIPGGAHTYSRGDDQYPSNAPQILERGEGAYVYDPEGNRYLDYGMALRAVTLGYGYRSVAEAAIKQIWNGNNLTRPSLIELQAAEALAATIPGAEMVKFGKNGSTITTAAVKLARGYTGRKLIARCLDNPFFSYDDWFIGDTVITRGIPEETRKLTLNFRYNDIDSLAELFKRYPNEIACVILEPVMLEAPRDNFLHKVKELCAKNRAVFILDEMITGFRFSLGGAQEYFGVESDLSTFGKGIANGFSVSALAGKREIMDIGGIKKEGEERLFLVSTTYGAEMCGMGALVETIKVYREMNVIRKLWDYGAGLISGMNGIARDLGIEDKFNVIGFPCNCNFITRDASGAVSLAFRTLFVQEMLERGVLMPWIAVCFQHGEEELRITLDACAAALETYRKALREGVEKYLRGSVIKPVFRKFN